MPTPFLRRLLRIGALAALSFSAPALPAQAQFAGTYIGAINTRVNVPIVGAIESSAGGCSATVAADGTITLAGGTLTGTVSASGAVTFTGGSRWLPSIFDRRPSPIPSWRSSTAINAPC